MSKAKNKDAIHTSQESHQVKCKLTDTEKAAAAMVLANAYQEQESLAIEKKAALGMFKQRADKLAEQIHVNSLMVQHGVEMRSVLCELQLNYTMGRAIITRLDLTEIVEERDMTIEEKQMPLPYKKKTNKDDIKETVEAEQLQFDKEKKKLQAEKDK